MTLIIAIVVIAIIYYIYRAIITTDHLDSPPPPDGHKDELAVHMISKMEPCSPTSYTIRQSPIFINITDHDSLFPYAIGYTPQDDLKGTNAPRWVNPRGWNHHKQYPIGWDPKKNMLHPMTVTDHKVWCETNPTSSACDHSDKLGSPEIHGV